MKMFLKYSFILMILPTIITAMNLEQLKGFPKIRNNLKTPLYISLWKDTIRKKTSFIAPQGLQPFSPYRTSITVATCTISDLNNSKFKSTVHLSLRAIHTLQIDSLSLHGEEKFLKSSKNSQKEPLSYKAPYLQYRYGQGNDDTTPSRREEEARYLPLELIIYSRLQSLYRFPKHFLQGFNLWKAKERWEESREIKEYGEEYVLIPLTKERHSPLCDESGIPLAPGVHFPKPLLDGLSAQEWRARLYGFTTCLTLIAGSAITLGAYAATKAVRIFQSH